MKYKTLIKTKLTHHNDRDYCELRSYEYRGVDKVKVIHCVSDDYKTCFHETDEYMLLTRSQLNKGVVVNTQKSKFPPYENYLLVEFVWKGKKPEVQTMPIEEFKRIDTTKLTPWQEIGKRLHG